MSIVTEYLPAHHYQKAKLVPSKIDPAYMKTLKLYVCPRCKEELGVLEVYTIYTCKNCSSVITNLESTLKVTADIDEGIHDKSK